MNKNHLILILAAAAIFTVSCKKEFQSVNTNPNALEKPDATTLLSNTLVSEFYNNANIAWTLGNGYGQYMTFSQDYYNTATRYQPVSNEPYWDHLYETARDADILYSQAVQKQNPLMEAAALTLRSYAFAQLTELWGDIPFKNALQGGKGLYTPPYDTQQSVYTDADAGILPSLRRADSLLKSAPAAHLGGDLLFNGNIGKWRKFINALRLRYLLRVSGKMNVSAEMQGIVTDGAIMQNASESASLTLPATIPYNFPSLTERSGDFNVKYLHTTLYNTFVATSDSARLTAYFTVNANNKSKTGFNFSYYGGMPMVVNASADQANSASHFSSNFTAIGNASLVKARIITYAEQEFILAEAALKGLISGSANNYYMNGVNGAYNESGLSAAQAAAYLGNPNTTLNLLNNDTALSQIITQKWIANINNGFEGWIEYRRTGYPALQAGGSVNLNGGNIPTRFLYPDAEKTINSSNYNKEIARMGGNEITTYKAWWEK